MGWRNEQLAEGRKNLPSRILDPQNDRLLERCSRSGCCLSRGGQSIIARLTLFLIEAAEGVVELCRLHAPLAAAADLERFDVSALDERWAASTIRLPSSNVI